MNGDHQFLKVERPAEHLLLVTINRPEVRNAFNTATGLEITRLFTELTHDPGDVRCVVLTGAGDRAFCAGADLKERHGMTNEAWVRQHEIYERMLLAVLDCPLPVIAAVNGPAFAGGFEMMLCCDFAWAVKTARFALTEVTLGIMPGGGGTQTLPRTAGIRRAKEIILSGRPFDAEQALAWGIVNRLCEPGKLMDETLDLARTICANAPLSVRQAKKSMQHGTQMDLHSGMLFEIEAYNRLVGTEDRIEGITAYNEKRRPAFKGR
ncbi:MAG: enoyl-CoA hydratase/isomerase family protein [Alphaproteobacteria bacterium]